MGRNATVPGAGGDAATLCPDMVCRALSGRRQIIVAALHAAGHTQPLTAGEVRRWQADPSTAPPVGRAVLTAVAKDRAQRRAKQEGRDEAERARQDELREKVLTKLARLASGGRRLERARWGQDEADVLGDLAFEASNDLARASDPECGQLAEELDEKSVLVLRAVGIDPRRHETWIVHRGNCRLSTTS